MEERTRQADEDIHGLIQKIKNGDREAFMTLTNLYQKKVYVLAYSFFHNRDDALDVVQETFLRFYQKIDLFKIGENFQNWLLRMAKNICIDYYRKHHRKNRGRETGWRVEEMNLSSPGESHAHQSSDLKRIISRCLARLSEKQRLIFIMKHYNGFAYSEISEILDIAVGTVKSLHFKAVQNLRALTGPYLGKNT